MSGKCKFKASRTPNQGCSPVNEMKRNLTPPLCFPLYSKFSNRLLEALPKNFLGGVMSYSTLLNQQRSIEKPILRIVKNRIVSYKPHSNLTKESKISMNNIEYDTQKNSKKAKIQGKVLKNTWKIRKLPGLSLNFPSLTVKLAPR